MGGPGKHVLGLDLGTTDLAMATLQADGHARVVPNADGHDTTPAAVHFYEADGVVIGQEAVKVSVLERPHVAMQLSARLGDPKAGSVFYERPWTPQELMALVMRKMREDAEEILGTAADEVVLAVPGWFDSAQRVAATEAASLAGMRVLSVLQQSTGAVLGFGVHRFSSDARILVVNVGGTSTECTILHKQGRRIESLATAHDIQTGGRQWARRFEEHLAVHYEEQFHRDPRQDPHTHQALQQSIAFAMSALAQKPFVMMQLGRGLQRLKLRVEREDFRTWTWDLVLRVIQTVKAAATKAGLSPTDLDEVILVGSHCLSPGIRRALWKLTAVKPRRDERPQTSIAKGTALAAVLRHRPEHPGLRLAYASRPTSKPTPRPKTRTTTPENHTPSKNRAVLGLADGGHLRSEIPAPLQIAESSTHALGIVVLDAQRQERVLELIPEGSPLPVRFRGRFAYAYDNMTAVRVEVTEGRGSARGDVDVIGVVELTGLPPRPRGTPIEVVYVYGLDQIIEVRVTDVATGKWQKARIRFRGGLSENALKQARHRQSTMHIE